MFKQLESANPVEVTTAVSCRVELDQDPITRGRLDIRDQNRRFQGSGEISQENRSDGFLPAFRDTHTGVVYLSRFADGRLAPIHLIEGLPPEVVLMAPASPQVVAVKDSVTAGFVRYGRFYTRQEAAPAISDLGPRGFGVDITTS